MHGAQKRARDSFAVFADGFAARARSYDSASLGSRDNPNVHFKLEHTAGAESPETRGFRGRFRGPRTYGLIGSTISLFRYRAPDNRLMDLLDRLLVCFAIGHQITVLWTYWIDY